jgi:hypothetical protein
MLDLKARLGKSPSQRIRNLQAMPTTTQKRDAMRLALERLATKRALASAVAPEATPPETIPPTQAALEDRLANSMACFQASYEGYEGGPDRWARALGKCNRPPLAGAAKTELSPKEQTRKALEGLVTVAAAAAAP